jgi:hypothetical protein
VSLASNVSSTTSVKGAITRLLLKSGASVSTQLYFRLAKLTLSPTELHRLKAELKTIWNADFPSEKCSPDSIIGKAHAYTFCSIRHAPTVDRFGNPYCRKTIIRAPRCEDHFYTAVATDVDGSYALVYAILDFCERTYCFVRWVTPTFPGSRNPPGATHFCAQHFRKLKITDAYSVINILQIEAVVCFVPVFSQPDFVWLNSKPLGTVLREYSE